ncbi:hypothetical protein CBL_11880 [Carabus blaptoides fortunei]
MFKLIALVFAAILAVVSAGVYSPVVSTYAGYTGYPYAYSAGYASPYAYSAGYVAPHAYSAGYVSPYSYSAYNGYAGYKYAGPYSYHY